MATQTAFLEVTPEIQDLRDHLRHYYGRTSRKSRT